MPDPYAELLHRGRVPETLIQDLGGSDGHLLSGGSGALCVVEGGGPDTHCLRRTPDWCMSLQPNALRSSSSSGGMPSSQDGVRSIWASVASGTRSGAAIRSGVVGKCKAKPNKEKTCASKCRTQILHRPHVETPRQTRVLEDSERMARARRRPAFEWPRAYITRPLLVSTGRQRQRQRQRCARPRSRKPLALCFQWATVASPSTFLG